MNKRANKRPNRKLTSRLKRLRKERSQYAEQLAKGVAKPTTKRYTQLGKQIPWMQGVKDVFKTHVTPKLSCSSKSGDHNWVVQPNNKFFRCKSCRISTYDHTKATA